jgi:hypothetical protein
MNESHVLQAAAQFGHGTPTVSLLGQGLIHRTYKVEYPSDPALVLQCINQNTFKQPENIIHNYRVLLSRNGKNHIPVTPLATTHTGAYYWRDADNRFWRATKFVTNSYTSLIPANSREVFLAAKCYGTFTRSLADIDTSELKVIIPGFHDLALRYHQFEEAVKSASMQRLLKSTHVIAELRQRQHLVDFYRSIVNNPAYRSRVMHHDCKMSNILLDATTGEVICPVDLDTVMPGYFFSDVGDMIRSMAATVDENSTRWEDIAIRNDYYEAIINGYMEGMGDAFTAAERQHIHSAGLMLLFMQSMRFVTDFLNNDTYYQITYPEQNLNRALNQLIMLEKLEEFLQVDITKPVAEQQGI